MEMDMPIWEQDKFMMPVIEDDALLMYGMINLTLTCFCQNTIFKCCCVGFI